MTLREFPELEQGSDQWLEQRRGMVTASVVGQLITSRKIGAIDYDCPACGSAKTKPCQSKVKKAGEHVEIKTMHPERVALSATNRTRIIEPASNDDARALTATLVAERITGWTDPVFVSNDMWRGVEDEPRAVEKYAEHYGVPVTKTGFMVREFENGNQLGFSPDGLVGDEGLIECKSRRPKKHLQTILANEVPIENMPQCQAGLLVSGRKWLDYLSYCGGMPLFVKRVYPDPKWQEPIIAALDKFEETAAVMVSLYDEAIKGFALTERTIELEMVI